ncbi:SET domain-containing protein [Mycena sanguinolenta]|uniref:SET domain-containing protein n=1 Tax=Mycena sanguinolenta TaxID=230812 RepID=A0A8H6YAK6_9AGAR|nr:SET domain-containing protein [Mycena sanguinolenta]
MSAEEILQELRQWLERNGGFFHSQVRLKQGFESYWNQVDSGFSVVASENLPADSKIVSCPFALVITKDLALGSLSTLLHSTARDLANWSERQLISTYLSFHWIIGDDESSKNLLRHFPYVKSLPTLDKLRTPLHFTQAELELLKGSNLYGATLDRQREWQAEFEECRSAVSTVNREWADKFTWELYLTAATHLSSRAFPSTLVSRNLTLTSPGDPEPILLPGVDSLNHARAEPVSWVQSYLGSGPVPDAGSCISLVLHNPVTAGAELFNNYGPKPNAELILGYGFSLPNNPDDTIVLKLGGPQGGRWEVGREARGADPVWDSVLSAVQCDEGSEPSYEDHLDAADALAHMAQQLLDKLPEVSIFTPHGAREDVALMIRHYIEGQREILESLIQYAEAKEWHGEIPAVET